MDCTFWLSLLLLQAAFTYQVENQSEHSPEYRHALTYILPFYSKSSSFVKLVQIKEELSCGQDATLHVQYIIKGEELKAGQEVLDFFYLVCI